MFSAEARSDLRKILAYVALDSPRLAVGLVGRLEQAAADLAIGALQYPVFVADIRRRVVGTYNIYYFVHPDRIDIYRILHSARNQQRLLFPED